MTKTITITDEAWFSLNVMKLELRRTGGRFGDKPAATYSDAILAMWNFPPLQEKIEEEN